MNSLKLALFFLMLPSWLAAQETVDLFIWAGQSNAQGYMGDAREYPNDEEALDNAILLNYTVSGKESSNGDWIPMQAQKGRFPAGHFGPEVSFGRELKKAGYHPAIFKYTQGGTGLKRDWKSPGEGGIYDAMVTDLKKAVENLKQRGHKVNIRGFIWIQGETDVGEDEAAKNYEKNLSQLIAHLRSEVVKNEALKVILGVDEQHYFVVERPIVLEAQQKIAQRDTNSIYTTMHGLPKADVTHLTPSGLVTHGHRIFKAYKLVADTRHFNSNEQTFADCWEYVGVAIEEPGYVIWGTSPVLGDDGKIHLFAARWPGNTVNPGWRSHSEIAHYVGASPEGPFTFSDVALKGTGLDTWDRYGIHNPAIHKINDKYILLYIGNNNYRQPPHPSNQKIGMAISDSPYGPWKKVNHDGLILDVPKNPDYWNYNASNGVNNPALLQHPNGGFFLYFKSEKAKMGLAVAENLDGPYVQMPFPITKNEKPIEDGYAFMMEDTFYLLTTDNHGLIEKGGGILWKSEDGITFDQNEQGFYPAKGYLDEEKLENAVNHYAGDIIKFERPQLLMEDGKPRFLYVASGYNWFGGEAPVSYIFKYK
ncbi:sialate O-acetylesterase [Cyclobacterium salsum]|uniref:sialate O-acetylesterase n=1 Tax=Cyclobacterium salsum TaxID=2666329 RepID=UPI001390E661|nr:sialate O-acetylesterase [Cyclobacterium salsum]